MSYYDEIHNQISKLERVRKEIISALNDVGVYTPANTTYDDLPDYVMKIGGVDTTNWPVDMSSIGYTAEDSRRASYRYICDRIDKSNDTGFLNIDNLKNLIGEELQLSRQKLSQWAGNANNFFDNWPGKFPPMLDTSNCTNFEGFLSHTACVHYPLYDTSNAVKTGAMFHWSETPHEIPEFDFGKATNFEFGYGGSFASTYIFSPKNIGKTPPESYYCMLGMLGMFCPGHWWSPIGFRYDSDEATLYTGAIITNMINFNPYNVDDPMRGYMFEFPPTMIACEGFKNLSSDIDLSSSTNAGDPSQLNKYVMLSLNSFRNIINNMRDITADLHNVAFRRVTIYPKQNYSNGNIKVHSEWFGWDGITPDYGWAFGYGYYSDAELRYWESIHGSSPVGSANYKEFLLQTGNMSTPSTSPFYNKRNVPSHWRVEEAGQTITINPSYTNGHLFIVTMYYKDYPTGQYDSNQNEIYEQGFDIERFETGSDEIYDHAFTTDMSNPLHDSNNEGLVNQSYRGDHPIMRINYWYWNNKLTQADRDLVLYKGWDVVNPA